MPSALHRALKQTKPFASPEEEVFLGLQVAANRLLDPWASFLRAEADLTANQYNVLRILRGVHPEGLPSGEIAARMISRDPDVTRLVDRLVKRGLVRREREQRDRRVLRVFITDTGLTTVAALDEAVDEMPRKLVGPVGEERLRQLRELLDAVIAGVGTFP